MSLDLGPPPSTTHRSATTRAGAAPPAMAGSPDPAPPSRTPRHPGRASVTVVPIAASAPGADSPKAAALRGALDALRGAVDAQTRPPDAVAAPAASASGRHVADVLGPTTGSDDEWLWLVDTSSTPHPRALERLLAAVEVGPSIGIAGCKQRGGPAGDLLLDAGLTTTRFGRLMTYVEPGDVDQGQLDHHEDVLAVRTNGLLVRRGLFDRLGGTDPELSPTAAALDLCRRARLAGHRVVVVPGAVVTTPGAVHDVRQRLSRQEATHLRLAQAPLVAMPVVVLAVLAGAVARLLLRVGVKEPGRGLADVGQTLAALARPDRVWRRRRCAARTRRLRRSALVPLLAGHRETARWHRERWYARRALSRAESGPAARDEPALSVRQRLLPPLLLTGFLTALSVAAFHRLVGPGAVSGGALPAAPRSVDDLWTSWRSSWRSSALGADAPADPFAAVLTGLSAVTGGSPRLAVGLLLVSALPLAGLGAWLAAGRGTKSRSLRCWAALVWAAAPSLALASGTGRLGPLVAHVGLPFVVWGVTAAVQAPLLRSAWTPAAAGGLALAVVTAAVPGIAPAALLALAGTALCYRKRALALVWTALPSAALLGPFVVAALTRSPRALLADPGLALESVAAPGWVQLLGQPVPPSPWSWLPDVVAAVAPLVATAVVVALAFLALLRRGPAGRAVRIGWYVALLGLLTAVVAGRVVVASDGSQLVNGWSGSGLTVALAGWVTAAVAGADGIRDRLGGHAFGWRQAGTALLAGAALVAPLALLGQWAWQHAMAPSATLLTRGAEPRLPEVVVDAARSGDQVRTLVLRPEGDGVRVALVRDDGPGLADTSALVDAAGVEGGVFGATPAGPDPAQQALDRAAAALVDGGTDARPALADLGAGYVAVVPGGDATDRLVDTLDRAVGLTRSGQAGDVLAWRVDPASGLGREAVDRAAAVRVLNSAGAPLAVVPATGEGGVAGAVEVDAALPAAADGAPRVLTLAERADDGWSATLDGRMLRPVIHAGWAQAFELPPEGGRLVVQHSDGLQPLWTTSQLAVGVLTLLLAVPLPASRHPRSRAGRRS